MDLTKPCAICFKAPTDMIREGLSKEDGQVCKKCVSRAVKVACGVLTHEEANKQLIVTRLEAKRLKAWRESRSKVALNQ